MSACDDDGSPDTLQSRLEAADHVGQDGTAAARFDGAPVIADPVELLQHLDVSGHFHRDGRFGRVFHRGMVSLRENVATDSLHVSVDGNRVTAHVDGVSPLALQSDGRSPYSARRAVKHNLAGMASDLVSLLRGRQGDHSCVLNCEWGSREAKDTTDAGLLDPGASAWSVQFEARVAGTLDVARLRAAVGAVSGAIERDPFDVVDCGDDAGLDTARSRLQRMTVAVTDSPPFQVCLARHPAGDVVMLNLNHAAADAVAGLRVLHAIADAYAATARPIAALDFLATRDLPVRPASPPASVVARSCTRAVERLRDVLSRTTGLAADQPADEAGYGFHLVGLSADETARLVDSDRTMGDLLLATLHLTIGEWNRAHRARGGRIGVLVPADLRPAGWPQDAIANMSVTARVSTTSRERADATSALSVVAAQTTRNERTRTGIALVAALQRAGLLALWAKQSIVVLQPLTANRLVDAAVLCNPQTTNEAPSFGKDAGATVALWLSTPARSPLSLCVGAATAGGRLHLTFRYPHRVLGPDAARRFADCYLAQLSAATRPHATHRADPLLG